MTITTDRDMFRLELGDTETTDALFSDEECDYFLTTYGDVLVAAAYACEALARRFASAFDFSEDGQSFSRSQMSKQFAQLAVTLRRRVAGTVSTSPTTRTDGYSDDIDYSENEASSGVGRVRVGYTSPDLPL